MAPCGGPAPKAFAALLFCIFCNITSFLHLRFTLLLSSVGKEILFLSNFLLLFPGECHLFHSLRMDVSRGKKKDRKDRKRNTSLASSKNCEHALSRSQVEGVRRKCFRIESTATFLLNKLSCSCSNLFGSGLVFFGKSGKSNDLY